ncbi:MAG: methyltransferase domain-containing protein [Candidatus Falkowbacteria bacterium]|nr:methyltransferase domain-containing protein [Candidatus Falkowbacteria bacterium]
MSDDNLEDLYNSKYYELGEFGFEDKGRPDFILNFVKIKPADRVLEVGCGLGVLLKQIPSENKIGVETNDFAIEKCLQKGLTVIKADAEKRLPFEDSSFDVVILIEVIEHLHKPGPVLKECFRVLSSNGRIFMTTPIRSFFAHNLAETHFSEMTVKELRELVEKCGFQVLAHKACGISFLYPMLENIFFKPFRVLRFGFKGKREKATGLIDSCHALADKTLLKPLNIYRKRFLGLGINQLIFAQKNKESIELYDQKYYQMHEFVFKTEERTDYKRILELLNPEPDDKVLEIGCGFGVLLKKIFAKKKIGIETNDTAIEECRKRGISVIKADVEKGLPFESSSFSIVIMNEVIAHLRNPKFVLDECFRVLMPKGKIIITTPARNLFFRNISQTHLSEMTIKETRALFEKCGFQILAHEVCGISFLYPLLENIFFKPFRVLRFAFKEKQNGAGTLIDSCHRIADSTILKPLSYYRKHFLGLGLNQLIFAQKDKTKI